MNIVKKILIILFLPFWAIVVFWAVVGSIAIITPWVIITSLMSGVAILMAVIRSRFAGDKQLMGTDAKKLTGLLRRALISPKPSVGIEFLLYFIEIPAPIELKAKVFVKIFNSSGLYYGTLDAFLCHSALVDTVCKRLGWPRIPISKYNFNHSAGLSGDLVEVIGFSRERVRAIGKRLYERFIECEWTEDKMAVEVITWLNNISLSPTEKAAGLWANLNLVDRGLIELDKAVERIQGKK